MSSSPFFSITIPFYYRNNYSLLQLKRNLNSIRNQLFQDYEIIISTQNKFSFLKTDPFFKNTKILDASKVKGFIQGNTNNAILKAKGQWIKVLFSDDYFYNSYGLQDLYDYIKKNQFNWIIASSIHIKQNEKKLFKPIIGYYQKNILSLNTIGSPSAIAFKNETNPSLFDINTWMRLDVDFYQSLYNKYGAPGYISNTFIVNEIHKKQFSNLLRESSNDTKIKLKKEIKYLERKFNYKFLNKFYLTFFKIIVKIERSLLAFFNKSKFKIKNSYLN